MTVRCRIKGDCSMVSRFGWQEEFNIGIDVIHREHDQVMPLNPTGYILKTSKSAEIKKIDAFFKEQKG